MQFIGFESCKYKVIYYMIFSPETNCFEKFQFQQNEKGKLCVFVFIWYVVVFGNICTWSLFKLAVYLESIIEIPDIFKFMYKPS